MMKYTYDDFVTRANESGLIRQFGQSDLQIAQSNPEYGMTLLGLMQDKNSATTAEQRTLADETINQLRANYGLLGQIADAQKQIENVGSFVYSGENAYQQALKEAQNMPEFSYDKENDPVYQSMRQTARRESQRAVEDTLARASVGTGGVASSYAVAAAQQAANNYTGALADAVPTLYQNALSEHQNEQAQKLQRVQTLADAKATEQESYNARLKLLYGNLEGLQEQYAKDSTEYMDRLNALNAAMGTLTEADIEKYSGGVSDRDVWQYLVGRYGEGPLADAGIKATGVAAIPEAAMVQLQKYPGGVVTSPTYWQSLLALGLTEADLNAAGFRLGTVTDKGSGSGGRTRDVVQVMR